MSARLVRVTAVAGARRSDVAVPGGVAVAELVPELARAVGLLDPAAAYAGYGLQLRGRRLQPDRGLDEQGVDDGALLVVTSGADRPAPMTHDDLVEATAEVVDGEDGWTGEDTRRTTLAAGLAALVVAAAAPASVAIHPEAAAFALVLVVLAGGALPAVAVACGVGRADEAPIDPDRVRTLVARSSGALRIGSVVVATAAMALASGAASRPAGAILAADCAVVLLLRARRHRVRGQVLVDAVGGLAVLAVTVLRLPAVVDPVPASVVLGAGGAVLCVLARLPSPPIALRARLLDLVETACLVALAPLLLAVVAGS